MRLREYRQAEQSKGLAVIDSIKNASERLRQLRSRRKWWRRWARRAAVALLLREGNAGLEVLMIQRAERVDDPWSGHMAFPGGLVDARDRNSLAAAVRETKEEIGLDISAHAELIARLSELGAFALRPYRRPLAVSPYVFALRTLPPLQLNDEVADVVWVPLSFLAEHSNRDSMQWRRIQLPFYLWSGRRIWGLSLQMLDEMLQHLLAAATAHGGGKRL